jgi:hypothetical protein
MTMIWRIPYTDGRIERLFDVEGWSGYIAADESMTAYPTIPKIAFLRTLLSFSVYKIALATRTFKSCHLPLQY